MFTFADFLHGVLVIAIGAISWFGLMFLGLFLLSKLLGKEPGGGGSALVVIITLIIAVNMVVYIDENFLRTGRANKLAAEYETTLPQVEEALQSPKPHENTQGILVIDRVEGSLIVVGGDMIEIPEECRAKPDVLPQVVISYDEWERVTGYCTGACPGGKEITETHYSYEYTDLSTGTHKENRDAEANAVKALIQTYCPDY